MENFNLPVTLKVLWYCGIHKFVTSSPAVAIHLSKVSLYCSVGKSNFTDILYVVRVLF